MRKLLFGCFVAALAIAGCGGSSKKATPAVSGATTNTTAVSEATTTTAGDGGDSDYAKLVEKASKARLRVTYQTTTGGTAATLLTVSQDGTGKIAYFSNDGDDQIIADGTNYTSCSNVKSTPTCTQSTGAAGQGIVGAFTALFAGPTAAVQATKAAGGFGTTSSETIAGRDATCVSLDYLNVKWQSCADKETGITLRWKTSTGVGGGGFEATEAGEPKASDFTPPATPETVPPINLPGVTMPGYNG